MQRGSSTYHWNNFDGYGVPGSRPRRTGDPWGVANINSGKVNQPRCISADEPQQLVSVRERWPLREQKATLAEHVSKHSQPSTLNLSFRSLSIVAESHFSARLQYLYLNSNQLREIPEALGYTCKQLWQLFVFDNMLTTLPNSLGQLKALHELDAHSNLLTCLPSSAGRLTSLVRLECVRRGANSHPLHSANRKRPEFDPSLEQPLAQSLLQGSQRRMD